MIKLNTQMLEFLYNYYTAENENEKEGYKQLAEGHLEYSKIRDYLQSLYDEGILGSRTGMDFKLDGMYILNSDESRQKFKYLIND